MASPRARIIGSAHEVADAIRALIAAKQAGVVAVDEVGDRVAVLQLAMNEVIHALQDLEVTSSFEIGVVAALTAQAGIQVHLLELLGQK